MQSNQYSTTPQLGEAGHPLPSPDGDAALTDTVRWEESGGAFPGNNGAGRKGGHM